MWESRSAPRSRPLLETRRADGKAGWARLRRRFDRLRSLHPFAERHPGAGDHRGLALVLAGAAVQRREQAEIDVHRLECRVVGPAGDVVEQRAERGGDGRRRDAAPQNFSRCETRSEEHKSELQSPMSISYAFLCLTKKNTT